MLTGRLRAASGFRCFNECRHQLATKRWYVSHYPSPDEMAVAKRRLIHPCRSDELQRLYYARGRTIIPPHYTVTNAQSAQYSTPRAGFRSSGKP